MLAVYYMRYVMNPFYQILEAIRSYDIHKNNQDVPNNTDIKELQELSEGLTNMIDNNQKDYV